MKKRPSSLSARIARLEGAILKRETLVILNRYDDDDPVEFQKKVEEAEANGANLVIVVGLCAERPPAEPAPTKRAATKGVR